jgi:enoyl-CoA hydratase
MLSRLTRAAPRRALSAAASQLVRIEIVDRVAIFTLNDPAKLNALTEPLGDAFGAAFASIDARAVGAVVLVGAGRAFSAGGDLDFLRARAAATRAANVATMRSFYARFLGPLRACEVPVVAAVHGAAVGAGACLATAADARVVSADARVGFTFAALGIHCGMGGSYFLPRVVGPGVAATMLLGGALESGAEMARVGWGAPAPDAASTRAAAIALAARMAAGAPRAVRAMTRTLRDAGDAGLDAALAREAEAQADAYAGPDFARGVEAVATKTAAAWTQY